MTSEEDQGATDMAAIREVLVGLDIDDSLGGESAQLVRQALAEHGRRADVLGEAARAVTEAVETRRANVAERDAATPSDTEIKTAQEAVVRASNAYADGTGTKEQLDGAVAELARLQRAKRTAQDTFQKKERAGADQLNSATQGLPDASGAGPGGPMGSLLSMLGNMKPPQAPAGAPAMPAAAGGDPGVGAGVPGSGGIDPALASLLAGDDPLSSGGDLEPMSEGEGQTHVSSDDGFVRQSPTLTGVQTAADISGRSGNPLAGPGGSVAPAAGGAGSGMGGMGAPMMPPMGGGRPGSDKKQQDEANIMNTDPDMTGDDIDAHVASTGVLGRAERRTS